MRLFWEFFTFELRYRFKSISTYVYFFVWLMFSFLSVASENFGPVGSSNGKVLLNSAKGRSRRIRLALCFEAGERAFDPSVWAHCLERQSSAMDVS